MSIADLQDLSNEWELKEEVLVEKRQYGAAPRGETVQACRRALIVGKDRAFAKVMFLNKQGKPTDDIQKVPFKRLRKVPRAPETIQQLTANSNSTKSEPPPPPLRAVPPAFASITLPAPKADQPNGKHHTAPPPSATPKPFLLPAPAAPTPTQAELYPQGNKPSVSDVAPSMNATAAAVVPEAKKPNGITPHSNEPAPPMMQPTSSDITAWLEMGVKMFDDLTGKHATLTREAETLTNEANALLARAEKCKQDAAALQVQIDQYGPAIKNFSSSMLQKVT